MAYQKVREVAEERGWTAARLARRADLAYGTVKALWDDPGQDTTISTLNAIAGALGVKTRDLIADDGIESKAQL